MLAEKLIALGFAPTEDFIAQDDGAGPYIKEWRSAKERPSQEEIDAASIPAPAPSINERLTAIEGRLGAAGL